MLVIVVIGGIALVRMNTNNDQFPAEVLGSKTNKASLPTEDMVNKAFQAHYATCVKCDEFKKTADDQFVSFNKKDGQMKGEFYWMYGTVTMVNTKTGEKTEHSQDMQFSLFDSGWKIVGSLPVDVRPLE